MFLITRNHQFTTSSTPVHHLFTTCSPPVNHQLTRLLSRKRNHGNLKTINSLSLLWSHVMRSRDSCLWEITLLRLQGCACVRACFGHFLSEGSRSLSTFLHANVNGGLGLCSSMHVHAHL